MSPYIAFDIQRDVIKRLPVKSLIRFRSVCKAWKSLIDSSEFISGYSVPQNQNHLLVKYEVGDRQETEFKCVCFVDDDTFPQQMFTPTVPPLLEQLKLWRIIGSSHGVLCFSYFLHRKNSDDWRESVTDMAILWNPSIRKSIAVVVPVEPYFLSVLGFGVCPHTCDPILVYIRYISSTCDPREINCIPSQVMIFTLSSGEWSNLCGNLPRKSIIFTQSSTVIGQFIYWFASDTVDVSWLEYRNLIVSFDMVSHEFIEIDLPECLAHFRHADIEYMQPSFSVSRLRESLVVLDYTYRDRRKVCVVWMMDHGDPKSFTKLFTIEAPDARIKRTLGFRRSGEPVIELEEEYGTFEGGLYFEDTLEEYGFEGRPYFEDTPAVYEPCTNHIIDIKDLEIYAATDSVFVNSYTESLLLLHEENDSIYSILRTEMTGVSLLLLLTCLILL
ncbi:LOW QUALITY PROTEIN: hypothetical protein OSB04_028900, partial [Centaurea solstitialis]